VIETRVKIINPLGLHARAAAMLVRTAGRFASTVRLERCDGTAAADAKSILSVLLLAAAQGTELALSSHGQDENEAISAVCALFADGFGERER
jgi:phosphotransferase system HPr (HPr) family protein